MIEEVSSLFDFWLKAQTREPYRQLAVIVVQRMCGGSNNVATFENAKKWLDIYAMTDGTCSVICKEANMCRGFVPDDRMPKEVPKKDETFRIRLKPLPTQSPAAYISSEQVRESFRQINENDSIVGITPRTNDTNTSITNSNNTTTHSNDQSNEAFVRSAANWTPATARENTLMEYGWYDREIEDEIFYHMGAGGLSREEALIRVFNDMGDDEPADSGA